VLLLQCSRQEMFETYCRRIEGLLALAQSAGPASGDPGLGSELATLLHLMRGKKWPDQAVLDPTLAEVWFRSCSRRMNELREVERQLLQALRAGLQAYPARRLAAHGLGLIGRHQHAPARMHAPHKPGAASRPREQSGTGTPHAGPEKGGTVFA
ncbi:MAG: hypothetical protein RJA36_2699, partial [Pseudomonadota bacterium]